MEAGVGESKAVTGPHGVRGFSLPRWMGPKVWEPTVLSRPGEGCEYGPGAPLAHRIPRLRRLPRLPSGLATRADGLPDTPLRDLSSSLLGQRQVTLLPVFWSLLTHIRPATSFCSPNWRFPDRAVTLWLESVAVEGGENPSCPLSQTEQT